MIRFKEFIIEMSAADKYERDVADYLNTLGVSATRPAVSSKYSDIKVTMNNKTVWVEVKMNHTDNLGNTRVFYDGSKWDGSPKPLDPLKQFCVDSLNKSSEAKQFVQEVQNFVGSKNIKLPTTKGGLTDPNAVPLDVLTKFFNGRNKYIIKDSNVNLGELVTEHYTKGKAEPAYYMQAGDDFYMIGKSNPLRLHSDIPLLEGWGDFKMRFSLRSKFYEIQPEIKITKMPYSPYSIKPGTKKKNPFS